MHRILIIGSGGAGKSTFAARLARRTALPLVHLDALYWRPGWVEPQPAEWEATIDQLIAGEKWILDGNYGRTLERRLARCDTVIFLDLPRRICLMRVFRRRLRFRGRARPDMNQGCPERLDAKFLWWIWTYPSRRRPHILTRLAQLPPSQQAIVLSSDAAIESFLRSIAPQ